MKLFATVNDPLKKRSASKKIQRDIQKRSSNRLRTRNFKQGSDPNQVWAKRQ